MTTSATAAARTRYATSSVTTASPARLLTMLYDRLVRDLVTAEECLAAGDIAMANGHLQHAQAIISELWTSLDTTIWSGGPGLADLYTYLHEELTSANVDKSLPRVTSCREIVEPLRDAWHQAAQQHRSLRGT